jgi:hypothetical protein
LKCFPLNLFDMKWAKKEMKKEKCSKNVRRCYLFFFVKSKCRTRVFVDITLSLSLSLSLVHSLIHCLCGFLCLSQFIRTSNSPCLRHSLFSMCFRISQGNIYIFFSHANTNFIKVVNTSRVILSVSYKIKFIWMN